MRECPHGGGSSSMAKKPLVMLHLPHPTAILSSQFGNAYLHTMLSFWQSERVQFISGRPGRGPRGQPRLLQLRRVPRLRSIRLNY